MLLSIAVLGTLDVELLSSNDRLEEENADQYIERLLDVQDTIRECALSSIKKAQTSQKEYFDKRQEPNRCNFIVSQRV